MGTLIGNAGGNVAATTGAAQTLLLLEKVAGFVSTVFVISNAANYLGPPPKPAAGDCAGRWLKIRLRFAASACWPKPLAGPGV